MKKSVSKKSGFTLAETLMTLIVIGVISAMTIPGLRKYSMEQTNVSALQKAASTVNQAVNLISTKAGDIRFWPWSDKEAMAKLFYDNMSTTKYCGNTGGCFGGAYQVYRLDGSTAMNYNNASSIHRIWTTADGMIWMYSDHSANCTGVYGGVTNSCAGIEVDVNGLKDPNTIGIDLFAFMVTPDGVFPVGAVPGGTFNNPSLCETYDSSSGWACTARVLKEGKISY